MRGKIILSLLSIFILNIIDVSAQSTNSQSGSIASDPLIFFTAENLGEKVSLHWATKPEIKNAGFEVEHSSDGKNFSTIMQIPAVGTKPQHNFAAKDDAPVQGKNYYRLKQTGADGKQSVTDVVAVNVVSVTFAIFPNPAQYEINIAFNDEKRDSVFIDVQDLSGKTILSKGLIKSSSLPSSMFLGELPKGVYTVVAKNRLKKEIGRERLIKN